MNDKIGNSIAQHYQIINELKQLQNQVRDVVNNKVRFRIEMKKPIPVEPFSFLFARHIDVSSDTMYMVLEECIRKERSRVDKLIDMEIDRILELKYKEEQ